MEEASALAVTEGVTVEETNNEESITTIEVGVEECQVLLECLQRKQQELVESNPMYE